MAVKVQAQLDYTVSVVNVAAATMEAAVAAVPLPSGLFLATSTRLVTPGGDVTTAPSISQVRRRILIDLTAPPFQPTQWNRPFGSTPPAGVPANYQGSVVSTSSDDAAGGIGMQAITISYHDAAGGAHTEDVTLNGKVPVNFTNLNYGTIIDVIPKTVGSFGGNVGRLLFYHGPRRVLDGGSRILVSDTPIVGCVDDSFYVRFPTGKDQTVGLKRWLTPALVAAGIGPVLESLPVLT